MKHVAFARKLQSMMKDNKFDRYVTGLRSGTLDTKRLHKIRHSGRLFKKKQERMGKDYSVSIVVDVSGSMARDKDRPAAEAVAALSRGLEHAKIPFEIVAFNLFDYGLKGFDTEYKEDYVKDMILMLSRARLDFSSEVLNEKSVNVTRFFRQDGGDRLVPVWDDEFPKIAQNMAEYQDESVDYIVENYTDKSAGWNNDGKAIYEARERMKGRKGRKIIIVLSDGEPAPINAKCHDRPKYNYKDFNLKDQVLKSIKEGNIFIGIGIESNAVERYYPKENTVVLRDANDIYPAIISKFNRLLKRE